MLSTSRLLGFGTRRASAPDPVENASSTRWRIYVTEIRSAGSWLSIKELEFRASVGGADQCSGGTPSASASFGGSPVANAFDNSTSTQWQTGTTAVPQWIEYQFSSAVSVAEVSLMIGPAGDAPTKFLIQYYDGATWQTWRNVRDAAYWNADNQTQTFRYTQTTPVKWRVNFTSKQGGTNDWCGVAELEMRATAGGASLNSNGNPISISQQAGAGAASNAYDGNTSTIWNAGTGNLPVWLGYHFNTQVAAVDQIAIYGPPAVGDSPRAGDIQYLDPMTDSWITYWSFTTGTWSAAEQRIFTKP